MNEGKILTHGKCILAGEHSVVRGAPALVLPLESRTLELRWSHAEGTNEFHYAGSLAEPLRDLLRLALDKTGASLPAGSWNFHCESHIPPRAGLGSSAALAVAILRFLEQQNIFVPQRLAFCRDLENFFHGNSSGLDIAGALSDQPVLFRRGEEPLPLSLAWKPFLYLTDCGERSATKDCVEKVSALARDDLDDRMAKAVRQAQAALSLRGSGQITALKEAMEIAAGCFSEWDLLTPALREKALELEQRGALAVKPTGSGAGGFLLSLWEGPQSAPDLETIWRDF
jgi:mevalonate kinase